MENTGYPKEPIEINARFYNLNSSDKRAEEVLRNKIGEYLGQGEESCDPNAGDFGVLNQGFGIDFSGEMESELEGPLCGFDGELN